MYGNYENIRIKQEPVDFEPIVTILELPESHGNKSQNQLSKNTKTKSRRKRNNPKKAKKFNLEVNDSYGNVDIKKEILDSENDSYIMEPVVNECSICFKRFAHANSLRFHMRGHTGQNAVVCDICGKQLSSKEKLKLHRRIHTGYKPYTCDVCSKGFAKKCNLTLHLRVHSGEKPYVCDVCGKCFSQRSTLVIHERYHTGQRPYICHLCHKGFVAKGVLSIHLKSCSRNTIMSNIIE